MSQTMLTATAQQRLAELRYYHGDIDNIEGPKTRAAATDFKRRHGFWPRPYIGPLTAQLLFSDSAKPAEVAPAVVFDSDLPSWYEMALSKRGLHERANNAELKAWFLADGTSLGDPKVHPWCGEFVQSSLAQTVGDGGMPANTGLARAWLEYGAPCDAVIGAIAVFWRGSRKGWKGHVAFNSGEDETAYHVLGGNQSNAVTITRIAKSRLLGFRWPPNADHIAQVPVTQRPATGSLSTNEA